MEKETCSWCDKEMDRPFWGNIVKEFCSLKCANAYLESEGFQPITGPNMSSPGVKPEYRNL